MKTKRIIALIIFICTLSLLAMPTAQANSTEKTAIDAEIMDVYGGRDGIISMTFDDGDYSTAVVLNELFEKYNLYGTLMMITDRITKLDKWNEVFAAGRLEPQNHSTTHENLTQDKGNPENFNEDFYKTEILDSKTTLETYFPGYNVITFAMPNGRYIDDAHSYAMQHYYAIRATTPGVQSLDPDSSNGQGSWYKMHSPVVYQNSFGNDADVQWNWIKKCIDDAANGWYAPIVHGVADSDYTGDPIVNQKELTYTMAEKMFEYISELDKEGKVWVTTYSTAVKYVRERQNSTVTAYEKDGSIYVRVDMNEYTDDGKELPLSIFNQPLTVKVPVPDNYGMVYYTTGGVEYTTSAFSDGAGNYVYLNVIPDGSDVKIRLGSTHEYGDWEKHNEETHKRTCIDCGLFDYGTHKWSEEGEIIKAPTHMKEGTMLCTCLICSDTGEQPAPKTEEHYFNQKKWQLAYKAEKANCEHGDLYYYSCMCGAAGTETFEVGEKEEHEFGKWHVKKPATTEETGLNARTCKECGFEETEEIPLVMGGTQEPDDNGTSLLMIIGLSAGGVVVIAAVAVVILILMKKPAAKGVEDDAPDAKGEG